MTTENFRVIFFALANGSYVWDDNGSAKVERIVPYPTLEEAEEATRACCVATGCVQAASLSVEPEGFADLPSYINALNFTCRLVEEMGITNYFSGELTSDLSHWEMAGVTTPRDLANHLDGCFEREKEKAAWG